MKHFLFLLPLLCDGSLGQQTTTKSCADADLRRLECMVHYTGNLPYLDLQDPGGSGPYNTPCQYLTGVVGRCRRMGPKECPLSNKYRAAEEAYMGFLAKKLESARMRRDFETCGAVRERQQGSTGGGGGGNQAAGGDRGSGRKCQCSYLQIQEWDQQHARCVRDADAGVEVDLRHPLSDRTKTDVLCRLAEKYLGDCSKDWLACWSSGDIRRFKEKSLELVQKLAEKHGLLSGGFDVKHCAAVGNDRREEEEKKGDSVEYYRC